MGEAGPAGLLVLGADVVPEVDGDERQRRVAVQDDLEAVREAVAEGLGLGVVAETAYRPDPRLVKLTISDTSMATQVHFICRKERHQAPLISIFLGLAHSVSQKIA